MTSPDIPDDQIVDIHVKELRETLKEQVANGKLPAEVAESVLKDQTTFAENALKPSRKNPIIKK